MATMSIADASALLTAAYERHARWLCAIAYNLYNNASHYGLDPWSEAQDAVQSAFANTWARAKGGQPLPNGPTQLRAYLAKATRAACFDRLRRCATARVKFGKEVVFVCANGDRPFDVAALPGQDIRLPDQQRFSARTLTALDSLPAHFRDALVTYYVDAEGIDLTTYGAREGISEAAAKCRMMRARKAFISAFLAAYRGNAQRPRLAC